MWSYAGSSHRENSAISSDDLQSYDNAYLDENPQFIQIMSKPLSSLGKGRLDVSHRL